MKNKKELIKDTILGSKVFFDTMRYTADGGGDSLNCEEFNINGIKINNFESLIQKKIEDELSYSKNADKMFELMGQLGNMGNGWYNDDGGKIDFCLDFRDEVISYSCSTFYIDTESNDELEESFQEKDFKNQNVIDYDLLSELYTKMTEESIKNISFPFYGSYDDIEINSQTIDGKEVDIYDDDSIFSDENNDLLFDAIERVSEGCSSEEGCNGTVSFELNEDKSITINLSVSLLTTFDDTVSEEITFDEFIDSYDNTENYLVKIIDIAKDINNTLTFIEEKRIFKEMEFTSSSRMKL